MRILRHLSRSRSAYETEMTSRLGLRSHGHRRPFSRRLCQRRASPQPAFWSARSRSAPLGGDRRRRHLPTVTRLHSAVSSMPAASAKAHQDALPLEEREGRAPKPHPRHRGLRPPWTSNDDRAAGLTGWLDSCNRNRTHLGIEGNGRTSRTVEAALPRGPLCLITYCVHGDAEVRHERLQLAAAVGHLPQPKVRSNLAEYVLAAAQRYPRRPMQDR